MLSDPTDCLCFTGMYLYLFTFTRLRNDFHNKPHQLNVIIPSFQRGTNQVKTIVKPVTLSSYLTEPAPTTPMEVEANVPAVSVSMAGSDAGSVCSVEAGPMEMLQVGTI